LENAVSANGDRSLAVWERKDAAAGFALGIFIVFALRPAGIFLE